jgi:hypothetical protein
VEIIVTRRTTKNGKRENVRTERPLLPSYLLAEPVRHLDNALADMALREPRKDVQAVLGITTTRQLSPILDLHNREVDANPPTVSIGDIALVTGGSLQGMRVKVLAVRGDRARVQLDRYPAELPLSVLTYAQTHVPQR